MLFGFRNGSKGKHVVTYAASAGGGRLGVPTVDYGPTQIARDGHPLATILREGTPLDGRFHQAKEHAPVAGPTTATLPDGSVLFRFLPDPVEPKNDDRYRIRVEDAAGTPVASLDMIRSAAGWNLGAELLDFALNGIDTSHRRLPADPREGHAPRALPRDDRRRTRRAACGVRRTRHQRALVLRGDGHDDRLGVAGYCGSPAISPRSQSRASTNTSSS